MMRGLAISTLVHASVLAMAVLSWPQPKNECERDIERLRRETPGISSIEIIMQLPQCAASAELPIDFLEIGRVSDVAAMRKAETPEEKPPEAEPEAAPVAEPEPEPETPPPPAPDEVAVPDPRRPEKTPEPVPEKAPPERRKELIEKTPPPEKKDDLDFLDDFDKTLRDKRTTERRPPAEPDRPVLDSGDRDREGAGDRRGNTASLQAALRRQIGYCWRGIEDLPREDQIDVVLRVELNRDGSLASNVDLISPSSRPIGRSGLAVDLALRAVRKCAPYKLPEDDYDQWKLIDVTIGPRSQ